METRHLGIRGNREYFGADQTSEPHLWTNVVICRHCGFVFTDPEVLGAEYLERDHYGCSSRYEATQCDDYKKMFSSRLRLIGDHAVVGALLDVGAGKGEFMLTAAMMGWEVDGVEPSADFCRYAKETHRLDIHHGVLGEVPEIDNRLYDAVTLNHVLEHVDDPHDLLKKAANRLKPEGVLFIEVPNCESSLLRLADIYFRFKGLKWSARLSPFHPPFHKYGYSAKSIAYLLYACGYDILTTKSFSGFDRGYKSREGSGALAKRLRACASYGLNLLGDKELLAVIARPF